MKMKKRFLVYMFLFVSSMVSAQMYEIGIFAGGSNYIGDIGSTRYINPSFPAAGGVLKFNYTPRINFRGSLILTDLKNEDASASSAFRRNRGLNMRSRIMEASGGLEFNFFKYSMNKIGYEQTPYLIAQASLVNYRIFSVDADGFASNNRKFSILPSLGLGYKMRITENFAGSIETSFRYVHADDIDHSSSRNVNIGNPNSDDWYVFTGITLTYGFGRPGCYRNYFN